MDQKTPLFRLKRQARQASRARHIPLHAALDEIAGAVGFKSWSLLAATAPRQLAASAIYTQLKHGELLLVAARPGHGKTLFSLELAVEATRAGHRAYFFSLEYTVCDVVQRLRTIGAEVRALGDRFAFDDSDDISADYVISRLAAALPGTLVVIDYLQLLDQRRDKPELAKQVSALKAFARNKSLIIVFLSQIDRTFEASSKRVPDLEDVRLPNPLDLHLFDKTCFLNREELLMID